MRALKQLAKMTNLQEPETTKTTITQQQWNKLTQRKYAQTYEALLRFQGKTWKPPHIKPETRLPFIPTETEIDQLIASMGKRTATILQTLKETGIRISEAVKLKWIDLSTEQKTLNITPAKGSNPRILHISNKLIDMLNQLPKIRETIFPTNIDTLRANFSEQRKTTAQKLQNPRLRRISFHTFRHWKGTMEYHKTKDIIHVKNVLGHKNIENTMIYINIEQALFLTENDEFNHLVVHNEQELTKAIDENWTLVIAVNNSYPMYFKKRK